MNKGAEQKGKNELLPYRKKSDTPVSAVQLDLDTDGFEYRKWGGVQRCKKGDWILNNRGEVYTVDAETFARTYREVSPGRYSKTTTVWVERADAEGSIPTKEGSTAYKEGDYLVYNNPDRSDGYAMSADDFVAMYEPDE